MIDFEFAPDSNSSSGHKYPSADIDLEVGAEPLSETFDMKTPLDQLPKFLAELNEPQREAALTTEGPLIVLAGAGSGKTKMLTARVAYLVSHCGVNPYQVLAVTFTNKAANEMKDRVRKALEQKSPLGGPSVLPEIGTFHSVCVRILRRELPYTDFKKPFVIYDDSDQLSLIKSIMKEMNLDVKKVNPKAVRASINRYKCDAVEPDEIDSGGKTPFERNFGKIYEAYQNQLVLNSAVDFGEIICKTYRLLRDHPNLREKYQRRFRYIHVDEYQDTNRAQYLLLSTLTGKAFKGHQNICVVGDEDQSIYGWRGADIRNILDFEKEYPNSSLVKLEQNYRSTKNIISAASSLISNNVARKDKTLWTENPEGALIARVQTNDERQEAEYVVKEIEKHSSDQGLSYDEFAVFYRTHAQSRQFEDILRREKIAYQVVGGLRFYDRKEIKDILAYLKVVLNPDDSVSIRRIINVPARGIGKTTIDRLDQIRSQTPGSSLWQIVSQAARGKIELAGRSAGKLRGFVQLIEGLIQKQKDLLLTELFHELLERTGYVRTLKLEGTVEADARIENLEEFDTLLQEFEDESLSGLTDDEAKEKKLRLLTEYIEQSSLASDTDKNLGLPSVRLMTLHGAKGLEFPFVFMVGLEEGLFPSSRPWEEPSEEEMEEERRLCYVGMTRARERLYMLNSLSRRIYGQYHYQEAARFFEEIPDNMIVMHDLSGNMKMRVDPSRFRSSSNEDAPFQEIPALVPGEGSQAPDDPVVGQRVDHPKYGPATIIASEGKGQGRKVTLEFKGNVRRKFVFRFVEKFIQS